MRAVFTKYGLPILTGLLLAWAFPTWSLFPLAWLGLVPLLCSAYAEAPWGAAKRFFLAGLAFHLFVLQWLLTNVYWAGGWAVVGYIALSAFMALYWGLGGALWAWIRPRTPLPPWLTLAVLWGAMEFAQATLFTGFGWTSLGYSQGRNLAILQWASIGGVHLVSVIIVAVNALIACAVVQREKRWRRLALALALLVALHGGGLQQLGKPEPGADPFRVGIVQSNFPLEMKWDPEYAVDMVQNTAAKSRAMATNQELDLIVWPEALIMDDINRPAIRHELETLTADTGCPVFTGTQRRGPETGRWRNSSVLVRPGEPPTEFYDKQHLAPFGEYVPLSAYLPFIGKFVPAIGDIEPGGAPAVFDVGERRFGPLICFEVLFGGMAEELRHRDADFLVVITNLGWFGASNAIAQELDIARVRAIETRLPLVHSANTGISGVFDPWGRFEGLNAMFDEAGRYRPIEPINPRHTVNQRLGGDMLVPEPAAPLVPHGPCVFPWLFAGLTALLCAVALFNHFRRAG